MIIQAENGKYYKNPGFVKDGVMVFCNEDGIMVQAPSERKMRKAIREMGIPIKSLKKCFNDYWKLVLRAPIPVPEIYTAELNYPGEDNALLSWNLEVKIDDVIDCFESLDFVPNIFYEFYQCSISEVPENLLKTFKGLSRFKDKRKYFEKNFPNAKVVTLKR